ncbi:MAG: insulinase family protein [Bacteroidaceae bacterium]|nr:insulinase family protein [Bacteroidaceae bacterium]
MKNAILRTVLFSFIAIFAVSAATAKDDNKLLPVDKSIRIGKLKNGLTYYIRHNDNPDNLVNFYIAQKVGSIQEEEHQRGLAHFLEHMCFNGTDHFPGKALINYLEGIGVKFGADLNAYTSIDETVYNIDNVPVGIEGVIDSCLWILRDWADGLTLAHEEIDKERGVIHEEWRGRNSAMMRMQERMLEDIFPGNKYGKRLPIGTMEVVDNFPYQALRDYYEKWYRPDLQAVVVVGDIDVNEVEKKIKKIFKGIKKPKNPAERVYYPVEDNAEMIFSQQTDKEQQNYVLQLMYKHDDAPREMHNTKGYIRANSIRSIALSMLNTRFGEIITRDNPPYLQAGVGYNDFGTAQTKKAFTVGVTCKVEQIMQAIPMVYTEVERARRFGFTQSELDRVKEGMFSELESWYAERDKRTSGYYVNNCVRHFLDASDMMSPEDDYKFTKELIESITLDEINAVLPALHREDNRVAVSYAPEKEDVVYPGKEDIEMLLNAIANARNITPYEDNAVDAPLLENIPAGGKVVSTEEGKWGSTIWTLSNGIKVVLKPTDFQADQITLAGYKNGGTNRYPDSERINFSMLGSLSGIGGFGAFDATQLGKKLAGSTASANVGSSSLYDIINASCSPKDVETMFQLMYLKYTSPRKDIKAFESLTNRMRNNLKDRNLNPNTAMSDTILLALYNNHPRVMPILAEDVDKIDYDRVLELYKDRTSDATGYMFFIVGNIDLEAIKPYVEQYIGALPCNGRVEEIVDTNVDIRKGVYRNNFKNKMENPTGTETIFYSGSIDPTLKNRLTMSFLDQILSIVYTEEVREKEGGTYGVGVRGGISRKPRGEFSLTVNFNMAPERREELAQIIVREFEKLAKEGPAEEHVEKTRNYILKTYEEGQKKNGAWLNWLYSYYFEGEDNHDGYAEVVNSITKEDIRKLAEYIIAQGNFIEVSMVPAE